MMAAFVLSSAIWREVMISEKIAVRTLVPMGFGLHTGPRASADQAALDRKSRNSDCDSFWVESSSGPATLFRAGEAALVEKLLCRARLGPLSLVGNVHLFDADELACSLGVEKRSRKCSSDALLVLAAYQRWGREFLGRINGDYAFCLWDGEAALGLCARDHIGSYPLFYLADGASCVVASHAHLIERLTCRRSVDESMVGRFLREPFFVSSRTLLEGVQRVPAGSCLIVQQDRAPLCHQYWQPAHFLPGRVGAEVACPEAVHHNLVKAVDCRLAASSATASHISGGVDSTLVSLLGLVDGETSDRIRLLISWAPEVSEVYPLLGVRDERSFFDKIGQEYGVELAMAGAGARHFFDFIDRSVEYEGQTDVFDELAVLEIAQNAGIDCILSGWGGDECVSYGGRAYLPWLLGSGRWIQMTLVAIAMARRSGRGRRALPQVLWQQALLPYLQAMSIRSALGQKRHAARHRFSRFVNPKFDAGLELSGADTQEILTICDPGRLRARMLERGHLSDRMETWSIWGGERGVRYSYPLLDRRVLECALSLPLDSLVRDGDFRYLARVAMPAWMRRLAGKRDRANEARRNAVVRESWLMLCLGTERGLLEGECPWLDLESLRRAVRSVPENIGPAQRWEFLELRTALRVWQLYQRRYFDSTDSISSFCWS